MKQLRDQRKHIKQPGSNRRHHLREDKSSKAQQGFRDQGPVHGPEKVRQGCREKVTWLKPEGGESSCKTKRNETGAYEHKGISTFHQSKPV